LLKNNGGKDYNFAEFSKNKNELPDEGRKAGTIREVFLRKGLYCMVTRALEGPASPQERLSLTLWARVERFDEREQRRWWQ
jgi:hypothetical protein